MGGSLLVFQGESFMGNNRFYTESFVYMVDEGHHILCFNDAVPDLYPDLKKGELCYQALMGREQPCPQCPLHTANTDDLTVFHPLLKNWISVRGAKIDYPGQGPCGLILCSPINDMRRSIAAGCPICPAMMPLSR